MNRFRRHGDKMRALAALALFLIGIYFISSFAQTFTTVTYQNERRVWQSEIEKRILELRGDLRTESKEKYNNLLNEFMRSQLRQEEYNKMFERRISELEENQSD